MAYEIYVANLAFLKFNFDVRMYVENWIKMQKIEKSKKSKNEKT